MLSSEQLRVQIKEGRRLTARDYLDSFRLKPEFATLAPADKAAYLRIRVNLALYLEHNMALATSLAEEAKHLDDGSEQRILEVRIEVAEHGPSPKALQMLTGFDVRSIVLHAQLLHMLGSARDAINMIAAAVDDPDQNAEVQQTLAILHLALHEREAAERAAQRARKLAPHDVWARVTAGIVEFYECVPDDLMPGNLEEAPEPLPLDLLKLDDRARASLVRANDLMTSSLTSLETGDSAVPGLELWKLACLSANPDTLREASRYAESLLYRTEPNDRAAQWVFRYGLAVDLTGWMREAEARIASGASTEHRLLLAWIAIEERRYANAESLLSQGASNESDAERIDRKLLLARSYADQNLYQKAIATLDGEMDPSLERVRDSLSIQVRRAGKDEPQPINDVFELLRRAEKAASERDWAFIVAHGDELLTKMPTAVAARLVLYGLYNAEQYEEFLKRYAEVASWNDLGREPQIRRARAGALWETGQHREAVKEAQRLFEADPSSINAAAYGSLLFQMGDYDTLSSLSEHLLQAEDLTAETGLRFAAWLQHTHPREAATLWDKAVSTGIDDDDLVSVALMIAYRVGRSAETRELTERMQRLGQAGKGGITAATFKQVVDVMTKSKQRTQYVNDQYRFGSIPIHMLADSLSLPLFVSHWVSPKRNQEVPTERWVRIYVRHGSRGALMRTTISEPAISLDLTSLLISLLLNVLQIVEESFETIVIPEQTFTMLYQTRDSVMNRQPDIVATTRNIVATVEGRGIRVAFGQDGFAWARTNQGFFVTPIPPPALDGDQAVPVTAAMLEVSLNYRQLIEHLLRNGSISPWQREEALRLAGSEGAVEPRGAEIPRGAQLLCTSVSLQQLDEAQLIGTLLRDGYELYILESDARFLRSRLSEADERARADKALEDISYVIRAGVARGKLQFRKAGDIEVSDPNAINTREIASVLSASRYGDIVSIDDRFCNEKTHTDKEARVVSLFDALSSLNASGDLPDDQYFQVLLEARAAGLFFIPLGSAELSYHLREALVEDGKLTETSALRTIRRYIGSALDAGSGLHLIGPSDEQPFLMCLDNALSETIEGCDATEDSMTRKSYVLLSLRAAEISALRTGLERNEIGALESTNVLVKGLLE
jgi:tetratricopeptide (TPR) repeat protein